MTALRTSVSYIAHFDPDAEDESEDKSMKEQFVFKAKLLHSYGFRKVRRGRTC